MVFCTLFDINYLDKGIALYNSLKRVCNDFKLYVLAMDEISLKILNDINFENIIVVNLDFFCLKMDLIDIRKTRTKAEFCWTCTSYLIDYVLNICDENICTYVDSDLYFFDNPSILLNEMGDKSVQIVKHGFSNKLVDKLLEEHSGTYCVQFNTFKNDKNGLELLKWWEEKCSECCSSTSKNGVLGDQGYLNGWDKYNFVSVLNNLGGGVAPWNVCQYKYHSSKINDIYFKKGKHIVKLVFFHFHNLMHIENSNDIMLNCFGNRFSQDKKLVYVIYSRYMAEIMSIKKMLNEKYAIYPIIYFHPAWKYEKKEKDKKSLLRTFKNALKKYGLSKIIQMKTNDFFSIVRKKKMGRFNRVSISFLLDTKDEDF